MIRLSYPPATCHMSCCADWLNLIIKWWWQVKRESGHNPARIIPDDISKEKVTTQITKARKRQKKTERDRKRQKKTKRDKKRLAKNPTDTKPCWTNPCFTVTENNTQNGKVMHHYYSSILLDFNCLSFWCLLVSGDIDHWVLRRLDVPTKQHV